MENSYNEFILEYKIFTDLSVKTIMMLPDNASRKRGFFYNRACKSRARKRGWGQLGAGGPYSPC